jgi:hypothetical protein
MNGRLDPGEDNWSGPEYMETEKYGTMDLGFMRNNDILDAGDGIPDFQGPPPPPIPSLTYTVTETEVILHWGKIPSEDPTYQDPFSRRQDFEGYRIYVSNSGLTNDFTIMGEYDIVDFAYYTANDSLATFPDMRTNAPAETTIAGMVCYRKPVGQNRGMAEIAQGIDNYAYHITDAHSLFPRWYAVTAYDYGDPQTGTEPLETAYTANALYIAPSGNPIHKVMVVPNPYRAYLDYTTTYANGLSWENQNDGTPEFFPQTDRRIEFVNLPPQCLIRIFTLAGDLVAIVPHNIEGDDNSGWVSEYSESWDLNSRNMQQVVSGIYLFSVEDRSAGNKGKMEVGKFVIIR